MRLDRDGLGKFHLSAKFLGGGDHVLQGGGGLWPGTGFQAAVGVDPNASGLQHSEDGLKLIRQFRHVGNVRTVDVIDAGADPLVVALAAEDLQ